MNKNLKSTYYDSEMDYTAIIVFVRFTVIGTENFEISHKIYVQN